MDKKVIQLFQKLTDYGYGRGINVLNVIASLNIGQFVFFLAETMLYPFSMAIIFNICVRIVLTLMVISDINKIRDTIGKSVMPDTLFGSDNSYAELVRLFWLIGIVPVSVTCILSFTEIHFLSTISITMMTVVFYGLAVKHTHPAEKQKKTNLAFNGA